MAPLETTVFETATLAPEVCAPLVEAVVVQRAPVADAVRSSATSLRKVLHLINGEHYAGAEKVQDLLALRLAEFGYQVGFACVRPNRFASARRSQTAPLVDASMRSRFDFRPAWKLARYLRDEGYHLLHTHTPRTAMLGRLVARLAGIPHVHHGHGQTATEVDAPWKSRASAAIERFSIARTARVIAVSESTRRYFLAQGLRSEQVVVVPNGVPGPATLPAREAPASRWTIGTVALLRPRKGIEILLQAIAKLRHAGHDVHLRIVGRFETEAYEQEIHAQATALGLDDVIDWRGFCHDVPAELAAMDVMVLPSLMAEGLPMVVIEAMAAGVPVVGTRVAGSEDVIRHEKTGLLATPGSADSLATQLARYVEGDVNWKRLRRAAHVEHGQRYSDACMARSVAEIYNEVLGT